jgi:hypothetical protein
MKVMARDPQFVKPEWLVGKAFRCVTCDKDYVFEKSDIETLQPTMAGYRSDQDSECPPLRVLNQGRTVEFQCCGCGRPATIHYYDFYSRNW